MLFGWSQPLTGRDACIREAPPSLQPCGMDVEHVKKRNTNDIAQLHALTKRSLANKVLMVEGQSSFLPWGGDRPYRRHR